MPDSPRMNDAADQKMPTVAVLMGTRPEAIKLAPVIRALRETPGLRTVVISTGQHREMLDQVVRVFGIDVDVELSVMRPDQTLAGLTARVVEAADAAFAEHAPDAVVVQGDTTTAFAAGLTAFYRQIPVAHVEAGLRTGRLDAPFPEEANRVLLSRITRWHFPPTSTSAANLLAEGVPKAAVHITGNTVIDALLMEAARQEEPGSAGAAEADAALAEALGAGWGGRPMVLITGHRRENLGGGFDAICDAIAELAAAHPGHDFVYPVHLNPRVLGPVTERLGGLANVRLIAPQPYRPFVALMRRARLILTDSGGVQEEAPSLGVPVLVMRETTERPEGVEGGTVKLVGTDAAVIVEEATALLADDAAHAAMASRSNPYGDGRAAGRIAGVLAGSLVGGL